MGEGTHVVEPSSAAFQVDIQRGLDWKQRSEVLTITPSRRAQEWGLEWESLIWDAPVLSWGLTHYCTTPVSFCHFSTCWTTSTDASTLHHLLEIVPKYLKKWLKEIKACIMPVHFCLSHSLHFSLSRSSPGHLTSLSCCPSIFRRHCLGVIIHILFFWKKIHFSYFLNLKFKQMFNSNDLRKLEGKIVRIFIALDWNTELISK